MKRSIIDIIAGARPNFMKVAPLFRQAGSFPGLDLRLVHTGQHYDIAMSDVFLKDLGLPEPAKHLQVGSGSHAAQTAEIMKRYEEWVNGNRPDLCVVVGDVNSTAACAMVAAKAGVRIAHVEAGLRSFDRTMPEEINRIVTDSLADILFVTERSGVENLKREGHPEKTIHLVGNVMIDTLFLMKTSAQKAAAPEKFGVTPQSYVFLTLHRPSNVDDPKVLGVILDNILWLAERTKVIFPVHPRTRKALEKEGLLARLSHNGNLTLCDPLGYIESLSLLMQSQMVITDSGGIQEETSALGIPCLTLRENTERPVTVEEGTNTLIGKDWGLFRESVAQIRQGRYPKKGRTIPLWDGQSAQRILAILQDSA